jgi:hypothetical protein
VEKRNAYNILVGEILRRLRKLTKNNIQLDVRVEVEKTLRSE